MAVGEYRKIRAAVAVGRGLEKMEIMSEPGRPQNDQAAPPSGRKRRIETQIHRRKKVKAVPPLEAEWDLESNRPSSNLRMPSDKMKRST
jgi:hypothetical protein